MVCDAEDVERGMGTMVSIKARCNSILIAVSAYVQRRNQLTFDCAVSGLAGRLLGRGNGEDQVPRGNELRYTLKGLLMVALALAISRCRALRSGAHFGRRTQLLRFLLRRRLVRDHTSQNTRCERALALL